MILLKCVAVSYLMIFLYTYSHTHAYTDITRLPAISAADLHPSYCLVGSQGPIACFYFDSHHARPAVPLRPPPSPRRSPTLESQDLVKMMLESIEGNQQQQVTDLITTYPDSAFILTRSRINNNIHLSPVDPPPQKKLSASSQSTSLPRASSDLDLSVSGGGDR
jgi:hypothetical protein